MRHTPSLLKATPLLALALLTACTANNPESGGIAEPMDVTHVHAIEVDPENADRVYVATHDGLGAWTAETGVVRVSESRGDFMGFAVGDEALYGSGHPAPGDDSPFALGLIVSDDRGATWDGVSLSGEADFHALTASESGGVGYDASSGLLRSSSDGETWTDTPSELGFYDLTFDSESSVLYGTTGEARLVRSEDFQGFEPVVDAPNLLLVDAFTDDVLVGIDEDGVLMSGVPGETWAAPGGEADGELAAFTVGPDDSVWLLDGSGLQRSTDRGATFTPVESW